MRNDELTSEQKKIALNRVENFDAILRDFQHQHGFELPKPWQVCVKKFLLGGLGDPELHYFFDAYAQAEYEAGRMQLKSVDYKAWAEEVKKE